MATPQPTGQLPRSWLVAGAVAFGALLFINVATALKIETHSHSSRPGPIEKRELDGVRLQVWADRAEVARGERLKLWVSLENRSATAIENVAANVDPGELRAEGPCWQQRTASCTAGETQAAPTARTMESNTVGTRWAPLQAEVSGPHVVTVVATWQVPGSGLASAVVEKQLSLSVGPIGVEFAPSGFWVALGAVYSFFKDLGLALLLGLAAYAFQHLQQERAQAQQDMQQKRAQVQETWNEIFPRAHENAFRHLLPLITSARSFDREAQKKVDPVNGAEYCAPSPQSLYWLVRLLRIWWDLTLDGGGIFFSDRLGEEVVYSCWGSLRKRIDENLGALPRWQLMDEMTKGVSPTTFLARFSAPATDWNPDGSPRESNYVETEARLARWMRDPEFAVDRRILVAMAEIMEYEVNRLYRRWYVEADPSTPEEAVAAAIAGLKTTNRAGAKELREQLETYVTRRFTAGAS